MFNLIGGKFYEVSMSFSKLITCFRLFTLSPVYIKLEDIVSKLLLVGCISGD